MGDVEDVDTSSFRCAVWNYVHSLFGVRHDDYNYNQVNQLLERSLKSYIKTVTCNPTKVVKKDYDSCMKEFRHSEKVSRASLSEKENPLEPVRSLCAEDIPPLSQRRSRYQP